MFAPAAARKLLVVKNRPALISVTSGRPSRSSFRSTQKTPVAWRSTARTDATASSFTSSRWTVLATEGVEVCPLGGASSRAHPGTLVLAEDRSRRAAQRLLRVRGERPGHVQSRRRDRGHRRSLVLAESDRLGRGQIRPGAELVTVLRQRQDLRIRLGMDELDLLLLHHGPQLVQICRIVSPRHEVTGIDVGELEVVLARIRADDEERFLCETQRVHEVRAGRAAGPRDQDSLHRGATGWRSASSTTAAATSIDR